MFYLLVLSVVIKTVICFAVNIPEDAFLTIPQIIRKYEYPLEEHWVTTEDGYILSLFRMPHGKNDDNSIRPPVLLVHGMGQATDGWILTGPENGLAYNLVDDGYDVWMINCRGTRYSLNHTYLDPNTIVGKFWDFSFYEIAIYDLPTTIDYILQQTKQSKLSYIGLSQGTTTFFILCSELPAYNDKIISFIGLAPAVYSGRMSDMKMPAQHFWQAVADYIVPTLFVNTSFNYEPLFSPTRPMTMLLCAEGSITQEYCWELICMNLGCNRKEQNNTLLPIMLGHIPTSYSLKQSVHYYQNSKFSRFARFDYGEEVNLKLYNSTTPPLINLNNINVPVYLFYSEGDILVPTQGVFRLAKQLRTLQNLTLIPDKEWTHIDYMFGKSIKNYVNKPIMKILNQYRNAIIN